MLYIRNKLYVIGSLFGMVISDLLRPKRYICIPGRPMKWVSIYNHLDWIRNQTNNQTTEQLC